MSRLDLIKFFIFFFIANCQGQITIIADLTYGKSIVTPFHYEYIKKYGFVFNNKRGQTFKGKLFDVNAIDRQGKDFRKACIALSIPDNYFNEENEITFDVTMLYNDLPERTITNVTIKKDAPYAFKINNITYQSIQYSINLKAPELYSMSILNEFISDKIYKYKQSENGFSNIVLDLENNINRDSYSDSIKYLEILNYSQLFDFLSEFAEEHSYYQEEAYLLNDQVSLLDSLLERSKDSINSSSPVGDFVKIRIDYEASKKVYNEYLSINKKIQVLYSQLQKLLFSLNCDHSNVYPDPFLNEGKSNTDSSKSWDTDISIGMGISFGKNALDQQLFLQKSDNGSQFIISDAVNNQIISPNLILFVTHFLKTKKLISYGFNIGIGANFQSSNNANLGFHTGATCLIGNKKRIAVNVGISFLPVRRLISPTYAINDTFSIPIGIDVFSEKVYRPSPFLSISYNLTK